MNRLKATVIFLGSLITFLLLCEIVFYFIRGISVPNDRYFIFILLGSILGLALAPSILFNKEVKIKTFFVYTAIFVSVLLTFLIIDSANSAFTYLCIILSISLLTSLLLYIAFTFFANKNAYLCLFVGLIFLVPLLYLHSKNPQPSFVQFNE